MKKAICALVLLAGCQLEPAPVSHYDTVILNGRVMDPESGLDAVRNVGIIGGKIQIITDRNLDLPARHRIDARGLVVAPGFIDLHSHGDTASVARDLENYGRKAADGVTSSLELEVGTGEVDRWYAEREGKSAVHHGVSIGHLHVRMQVLGDPPSFLPPPASRGHTQQSTDAEVAEITRRI
jgi:cytosine/adenosine deaminase-related metal-dependent hydrolase